MVGSPHLVVAAGEVVGRRLSLFSPRPSDRLDAWVEGVVSAYAPERGQHLVVPEDGGGELWVSLGV
jgi:hypothetical protein